MTSPEAATVALLAATCVHLGFQVTVTAVVYPALARASDWSVAHDAHTRAITPVVVLVYGVVVATAAWALAVRTTDPWTWVSVGGAAVSVLATALVAGPAHGRLSGGRDEGLVRRVLAADRVRTAGALVAVVGAVAALV